MMATSFERHAVQRYFESQLGCSDLTQWKTFKPNLQSYVLSASDVYALAPLLIQDAVALYTQALQSFAQAITALKKKQFAWPIVEFYYAVFYSMRSELHASSVIAVKNGSIYYMPNTSGSTFNSIQEKGSHQTYIRLRKTLPASIITRDVLLDNVIEPGIDVYSWMCLNRERVNYHQKHFPDPEPDFILQKVYDDYVLTNKLTDLLNLYESNLVYCFDKDHATLAIPYKKLKTCRNLLLSRANPDSFEQKQFASVKNDLIAVGIDESIANNLVL